MPTRSVSAATQGPWAPTGSMSARQLRERFIRSLDVLPSHVRDLRRVLRPKIRLLARPRHVVRAVDHRLHPSEPRVPRRADLLFSEAGGRPRQRDERIAALVQAQPAVHLETEAAHRLRRRRAEQVDDGMVHVVRELPQRPGVPVGGDALGVERGELALEFADDGEVQVRGLARRAVAQDRACLARVVVAVVAEIYDAPADLRLQASRGADLGHEEPSREEPAGLLAERDDWLYVRGPDMAPPTPQRSGRPGEPGAPLDSPRAHPRRPSLTPARGGRTACSATLKAMHAAQPMRLYQR